MNRSGTARYWVRRQYHTLVYMDMSINGFIPLGCSEESSSRQRTLNSSGNTSQKKLMNWLMKESTKISLRSQTKCITTFWTLMQESSSTISWLTKICLGSDSILPLTLTYGQVPDSVKNSKLMFSLRFIQVKITSGFIHLWEELMSATISEE
jgi:hypothetical protein